MNRIELLAPARDLETGLAAIDCGADAVYIGAARFGAREAAGNSLEAIEQLSAYAHVYWAKVYAVVNTLLYDEELPAAVALIHRLYQVGVDALIIQDLGLLECDLPPLPLIASTQMHNHTPERVKFLEGVGFQRAILARELNLEQIRAIRLQTTLELECFIHGALCVSYSGQCYLSYAIGGRSGNRGQCAQSCRQPYSLADRDSKAIQAPRYLLSLRDLNLTASLGDLLKAGVTSFKIEGRLKDRSYVTNIVSHYRRELDRLLEGSPDRPSSSGRCTYTFIPDPLKTFNRGYTSYFLRGRGEPVASPDTPKSTGEPLGKVKSLDRSSFSLDREAAILPGDGLCFFDQDGELAGAAVYRVVGRKIYLDSLEGLRLGTQVYRNHDRLFQAALEKDPAQRKIAVTFQLEETPSGFRLAAQDEDGNRASFDLECEKIPAEKPEVARASVEKQLQKTGGTEFACRQVEFSLQIPYFIPVSALNALRRGALAALAHGREQNRPRPAGGILPNAIPFPEKKLTYLGNVLNQKAAAFYRRHGVTSIAPAAESGLDMHGLKVMTTKYCLKYQLGACPKEPEATRLNEPLSLVNEHGEIFPLRFNCALCQMEVYRK